MLGHWLGAVDVYVADAAPVSAQPYCAAVQETRAKRRETGVAEDFIVVPSGIEVSNVVLTTSRYRAANPARARVASWTALQSASPSPRATHSFILPWRTVATSSGQPTSAAASSIRPTS